MQIIETRNRSISTRLYMVTLRYAVEIKLRNDILSFLSLSLVQIIAVATFDLSYFFDTIFRLGRRNPSVNEQQLEKFKAAIVEVLRRRYRDHWFPEKPFKGSGYRCIRINGKMDPVIAQAAETCGLAANLIHSVSTEE